MKQQINERRPEGQILGHLVTVNIVTLHHDLYPKSKLKAVLVACITFFVICMACIAATGFLE